MIVLFRVQDIQELYHGIDLAALMQQKLPLIMPTSVIFR